MRRNWYEHRIVELCKKREVTVHFTEEIIDSSEHIDIVCTYKGVSKSVDIKGASKVCKHDKHYSTSHRWMEIRNNNGLRGSLFGKADYLVVASPNGWLWLDRNELAGECVLRYIENNGKTKERDDWHTRAVKGRNSIIILVPYKYLYSISKRSWADNKLINRCYATTK
jgi:hypothetical protein